MKGKPFILAASCALAACSAPVTKEFNIDSNAAAAEAVRQRIMVTESRLKNDRRILDIANNIRREGVDLCGEKIAPTLAMKYANLSQAQQDWRPTYIQVYGLDSADRLTVYYTAEDGPADAVGLRPGDVLLAVDGTKLKTGKRAGARTGKLIRKALEKRAESVTLDIERDGAPLTLHVAPTDYCDSPVNIVNDSTINAYATGKAVFIHAGMLRFIENDDELALVIGHEISHNAMLHIEKQKKNAAGGAFFGALLDIAAAAAGVDTGGGFTNMGANAGARTYSVAFEQEADYVGLYMVQRAGYDISRAPDFWRRMSTVDPRQITYSATHPSNSERFLALEQTVTEINIKSIQRLALAPDLKSEGESGGDVAPTSMLASGESSSGMGLAAAGMRGGGDDPAGLNSEGVGKAEPLDAESGAPALAAIAPASGGGFALLLGSYSSAATLDASWTIISSEHGDLLEGLVPRRIEAAGDDGESTYRLTAGPLDSEMAARRACQAFKAQDQYCAVTGFAGEALED